jgi:hypothetical protein
MDQVLTRAAQIVHSMKAPSTIFGIDPLHTRASAAIEGSLCGSKDQGDTTDIQNRGVGTAPKTVSKSGRFWLSKIFVRLPAAPF